MKPLRQIVLPQKSVLLDKEYCYQINEMQLILRRFRQSLINKKEGPILLHRNLWPHVQHKTLHKLNKLGSKLCFIRLTHQTFHPLIISLQASRQFPAVKVFHQDTVVKNAFDEFITYRTPDFYANEINTQVSLAKMYCF